MKELKMAIDHELFLREEITASIGKAGLLKQARSGAGVWLLDRRAEAHFVKLSEFYDVFKDQRKVDNIKLCVSHADLSRQAVAIWVVGDIILTSNLRVVDIA